MGLQVRIPLSLNLLLDDAVCSAADLNSIVRTCSFHYIGVCRRSGDDVYKRFRNILEECAEKMIVCASDLGGVLLFLTLTHVESITRCNIVFRDSTRRVRLSLCVMYQLCIGVYPHSDRALHAWEKDGIRLKILEII